MRPIGPPGKVSVAMTMKISSGETEGLYWLFPITLRKTKDDAVSLGFPESVA